MNKPKLWRTLAHNFRMTGAMGTANLMEEMAREETNAGELRPEPDAYSHRPPTKEEGPLPEVRGEIRP